MPAKKVALVIGSTDYKGIKIDDNPLDDLDQAE